MKINMYAVYDVKADVYGQIFNLVNDDVAKRVLVPTVNNPEHNYGMFPEDFYLTKIGTYDDSTGIIQSDLKPICKLDELKKEAIEKQHNAEIRNNALHEVDTNAK